MAYFSFSTTNNRDSQTFQPVSPKITIPETRDPHLPLEVSYNIVHSHTNALIMAYVNKGINTTKKNNSLTAIILVQSNLRKNIEKNIRAAQLIGI